jgi:hypothetical protein
VAFCDLVNNEDEDGSMTAIAIAVWIYQSILLRFPEIIELAIDPNSSKPNLDERIQKFNNLLSNRSFGIGQISGGFLEWRLAICKSLLDVICNLDDRNNIT